MVFNYRMGLLIVIDAILVNSSMIIALLIRFDGRVPLPYSENYFYNAPYVTVIVMILFFLFGLYRRAWKYASINELLAILGAVALGNLAALIFMFYINGQSLPLPKSVIIIYVVLQSVFIGGSRLFWRLYRDYGQVMMNKKSRKRVLIVGAGDGGVLVAKEMKSHYKGEISIIGFIDDDESKQKMIIQGVPVLGKRNDIPRLVEKHQVEEIIIAIPSAGGSEKKKIFDICRQTKAKVKTLPGVYDLIDGRFRISSIRNVEVEDLLGIIYKRLPPCDHVDHNIRVDKKLHLASPNFSLIANPVNSFSSKSSGKLTIPVTDFVSGPILLRAVRCVLKRSFASTKFTNIDEMLVSSLLACSSAMAITSGGAVNVSFIFAMIISMYIARATRVL